MHKSSAIRATRSRLAASASDLIGTNLEAPFFLSQLAYPSLAKQGGSIVNMADIHGLRPLANHAVYSTAKAGLMMLTRALAADFAPAVRVNAVAPGAILWPENGPAEGPEDAVLASIPAGRTGSPEDVARTVVHLAVDAPYITGQVVAVDGGKSLT